MSAALLVFSFPDFNLYLLAWAAFVPLFFAIEGLRPFKAFCLSYLAGVLFFLGTIWWLIHVTLPGMITVILYLALYFGLFGLFFRYASRARHHASLFLLPAAWVTLEWLRSNGIFGFGWALLAHSQSLNLPVIQIADMTGAYGVSFLAVMANVLIYTAIKNRRRPADILAPLGIVLLVVFLALAYGQYRLKNIFVGERLNVAVVQGNISQDRKWDSSFRDDIIKGYETLTREAAKEPLDLVIWPETAVPGYLETDAGLVERLRRLAVDIKTPLLVGAPREDRMAGGVYYNSAFLFSEFGQIVDYYDKAHLVPFGEYIPFKGVFSFVERFAPIPIGNFSAGRRHTVFRVFLERSSRDADYAWKLIKKASFSALICFEDIFPELSRESVKNGAAFLVNITNDAWFKESSAPYQHAQSSVFRAVENRTNVIRAANTGLSCFIDQKGRMTDPVQKDGRHLFIAGFKSHEIVFARTRTFYTLYGDIFAFVTMLLTVVYIARAFRRPDRRRIPLDRSFFE